MLQKIIVLVFLSALPFFAFSQDKIETDRPTESQNASLVSKGVFQAEIGLRKDQEKGHDYSIQHPNAVIRFGLFDGLELRLEAAVETQRFYSKNSFNYGMKPVEVGIKGRVFQTKDTSFIASLYGLAGLPRIASGDHQHQGTYYRIRLLLQNELSEKVKLIYNVGQDWDNEERQQNWIYAVAPQFQISDKWDLFLESFGYFQKSSKPEHYIDGGLAYYITNNMELDIDVGKGLGSKSADYFMTAGISFKL